MEELKKKLYSLKNARGSIAILIIFIIIIIFGSILLVGGIAPKPPKPNSDTSIYTPDEEILRGSQNNLQLRTIKFSSCASTAAVDFLVDRSGSMSFGTKLGDLKDALYVFAGSFPKEGIIGMQSFSTDFTPVVSLDYFKNVKSQFLEGINDLNPAGGTSTKNAFISTKPLLASAIAKFPDYKFNLIFISDGVPETLEANIRLCPSGVPDPSYCTENHDRPGTCRCFDTNQDPAQIADEIKQSGVRIFTIWFIDTLDDKFQDDLKTLMENVASSPTDSYRAPIGSQLTDILQQISVKICR